MIPAADRVPVINVEKTCKDSVAADQEAKVVLAQPFEKCMRDENDAKLQLSDGEVRSALNAGIDGAQANVRQGPEAAVKHMPAPDWGC